jgi:hypothetical protein
MNTETGELRRFPEELLKEMSKQWIPVKESDITEKQKANMQVSKKDNKSELGKIFTEHRKLSRKQKNRIRRKNYESTL